LVKLITAAQGLCNDAQNFRTAAIDLGPKGLALDWLQRLGEAIADAYPNNFIPYGCKRFAVMWRWAVPWAGHYVYEVALLNDIVAEVTHVLVGSWGMMFEPVRGSGVGSVL
jgi:hypothetical protein